ncbi:MAG: hypothetical protein GU352_06440 [Acidilobus sp.]|jgi:hypothetical protein|nr:hypothetical protein [Acidilobus sp.]
MVVSSQQLLAAQLSQLKSATARLGQLPDPLRRYVDEVLRTPDRARDVAARMLTDEETMLYLSVVSMAAVALTPEELSEQLRLYQERFRDSGVDVTESLEVIEEHDMWKLKQLRENLVRYASAMADFVLKYPEDAHEYLVTYLSTFLLLMAALEARSPEELVSVGRALNKVAEDLEAFTLTFRLTVEGFDGERQGVVGVIRGPDDLRRVLS